MFYSHGITAVFSDATGTGIAQLAAMAREHSHQNTNATTVGVYEQILR